MLVATQEQRRAETRSRLLDAAAELFAARGVEGASIDAIAELADRTSGAIYDHFGGKEGLLFALLEGWVGDVAAVIGAELATATTLDERLATLWRNVAEPPLGRWPLDRPRARAVVVGGPAPRGPRPPGPALPGRLRRGRVGGARSGWADAPAPGTGATVIGLLFGLEMMRRIDGSAVDEGVAVAALRGALADGGCKRSRHSSGDRMSDCPRGRAMTDRPTIDGLDLLAGTWEEGVPYDQFDRLRREAPGRVARGA